MRVRLCVWGWGGLGLELSMVICVVQGCHAAFRCGRPCLSANDEASILCNSFEYWSEQKSINTVSQAIQH